MSNEAPTGSHTLRSAAPRPLISFVVAMSDQGVIGRDNALPWRLPADLRRFKALTLGKPVLMGRKTFEAIGRPLPQRQNIVLTHAADFAPRGVTVVHSFAEALAQAAGSAELMVIGGAQVYRLALPHADRIHLTRVHADTPGDTRFPALDPAMWEEREREERPADAQHAYAMTFSTLSRAQARSPGRTRPDQP
jgi:dihydrofolate reductase